MTNQQLRAIASTSIRDLVRGLLHGAFWIYVASYLVLGKISLDGIAGLLPSLALVLFAYFGIIVALNVASYKGEIE